MATAIDQLIQECPLSLEAFLDRYSGESLSICRLIDGEYEIQQFRGNQPIGSPTFPNLRLTAEQVLRAGRAI